MDWPATGASRVATITKFIERMKQPKKKKKERAMLMLSQKKLAPPKQLDGMLVKHEELVRNLAKGRDTLRTGYAENTSQVSLTLNFFYPNTTGDLVSLAKMLDNCGELEEYMDCLPGFEVYRRYMMRWPKGMPMPPGNARAQLRAHQRQKGADMVLQIILVDAEWKNEGELVATRHAVHTQGFSMIVPNFDAD